MRKENKKDNINNFRLSVDLASQIYNSDTYTEEEKSNALNFICDLIKNDLIYTPITDCVYGNFPHGKTGYNHQWRNGDLFPISGITDIKGENVSVEFCGMANLVNMSHDHVISFPWKERKFVESISRIKNAGFKYDDLNLKSSYFHPFKLCVITNGYHNAAIAAVERKGTFYATSVYDFTLVFPHMYSDGAYWRNIHTNIIIEKVKDFKVAAIYEIHRLYGDIMK